MSVLRETIRFAEEYGYNRWIDAQDELNDIERELREMRTQLDELHRHNDRLHRRLEQGTDLDALRGEVRKERERATKQRHRADRAEAALVKVKARLQLVSAELDEARHLQLPDIVVILARENMRLKSAYARLVERLRLATPQSLVEVTDADVEKQLTTASGEPHDCGPYCEHPAERGRER